MSINQYYIDSINTINTVLPLLSIFNMSLFDYGNMNMNYYPICIIKHIIT